MQSATPVRMTVHWVWQVVYAVMFFMSLAMALLLITKGHTFGFFFLVFAMFVGYMMKMARFYVEADVKECSSTPLPSASMQYAGMKPIRSRPTVPALSFTARVSLWGSTL